MIPNNEGNSPTFVLEFKDFDIKEIVYSVINMFSVFVWDNDYKNPKVDKTCSKYGVVIDSFDCRDRVAEFAWVIS